MKRSLLGGLLLVGALMLTACGGDISRTPTPSTSTPTPSTSTPTPSTSKTSPAKAVIVATPKMMAVVNAWGTSITVWTSATDPIADLAGLTGSNVGFWNNSSLGMGTYTAGKDLFAAFGEPRNDGLYGCPSVDRAFTATGGCGDIRIYFADSTVTSVAGGIPVVFEAG